MSYRKVEFDRLDEEFKDSAALILNDTESTQEQLQVVIDAFNAIIIYSELDYENKRKNTKALIKASIEVNRLTLQHCFEKLNLPTLLPGKLLSTIHFVPKNSIQPKPTEIVLQSTSSQTFIEIQNVGIQTAQNMVQSAADFLKLASALINYKYEGDPLKLATFLADVDLVTVSAEEANAALCITFVRRCLTGKALECLTDADDTIAKIKKALSDNIKPESAGVSKEK